jgi:hypothetical protein
MEGKHPLEGGHCTPPAFNLKPRDAAFGVSVFGAAAYERSPVYRSGSGTETNPTFSLVSFVPDFRCNTPPAFCILAAFGGTAFFQHGV